MPKILYSIYYTFTATIEKSKENYGIINLYSNFTIIQWIFIVNLKNYSMYKNVNCNFSFKYDHYKKRIKSATILVIKLEIFCLWHFKAFVMVSSGMPKERLRSMTLPSSFLNLLISTCRIR